MHERGRKTVRRTCVKGRSVLKASSQPRHNPGMKNGSQSPVKLNSKCPSYYAITVSLSESSRPNLCYRSQVLTISIFELRAAIAVRFAM